MKTGSLPLVKMSGVNRRTMKMDIRELCRRCLLNFAGAMWIMVLATVPGCSRREAEFLKNAGETGTVQAEGKAGQEDAGLVQETAGQEDAGSVQPSDTIFVDVCGAVVNPGVYELDADSRVFQAIEAAGGLIPEAAGEYVNKAEALSDGQQIYIPTNEEAETDPSLKSPLEKSSDAQSSGDNVSGGGGAGTGTESSDDRINLNTADEDALTTLTGIGASKAQAILAYREEHGGFSAIEEILNVPGIKEGTFVKIKDQIVVE